MVVVLLSSLTIVPSHSETKSRVGVTSAVLRNSTRKRKPSRHFTETLHHTEDSNTSDRITEENRNRTGVGESSANTQEETSSNGSTKSDELNVTRFETAAC